MHEPHMYSQIIILLLALKGIFAPSSAPSKFKPPKEDAWWFSKYKEDDVGRYFWVQVLQADLAGVNLSSLLPFARDVGAVLTRHDEEYKSIFSWMRYSMGTSQVIRALFDAGDFETFTKLCGGYFEGGSSLFPSITKSVGDEKMEQYMKFFVSRHDSDHLSYITIQSLRVGKAFKRTAGIAMSLKQSFLDDLKRKKLEPADIKEIMVNAMFRYNNGDKTRIFQRNICLIRKFKELKGEEEFSHLLKLLNQHYYGSGSKENVKEIVKVSDKNGLIIAYVAVIRKDLLLFKSILCKIQPSSQDGDLFELLFNAITSNPEYLAALQVDQMDTNFLTTFTQSIENELRCDLKEKISRLRPLMGWIKKNLQELKAVRLLPIWSVFEDSEATMVQAAQAGDGIEIVPLLNIALARQDLTLQDKRRWIETVSSVILENPKKYLFGSSSLNISPADFHQSMKCSRLIRRLLEVEYQTYYNKTLSIKLSWSPKEIFESIILNKTVYEGFRIHSEVIGKSFTGKLYSILSFVTKPWEMKRILTFVDKTRIYDLLTFYMSSNTNVAKIILREVYSYFKVFVLYEFKAAPHEALDKFGGIVLLYLNNQFPSILRRHLSDVIERNDLAKFKEILVKMVDSVKFMNEEAIEEITVVVNVERAAPVRKLIKEYSKDVRVVVHVKDE